MTIVPIVAEWRALLAIALPVMVSVLISTLAGVIDMALLGHYAVTHLSAASLGVSVLLPAVFGISAIGRALIPLWGRQAPEQGPQAIFGASLALTALIALPASLAVVGYGQSAAALGVPDAVLAPLAVYTSITALALPLMVLGGQTLLGLLALNRAKDMVPICVVGLGANALTSLLLIHGLGPVPAFGAAGAAIGMVMGAFIILVLALAAVHRAGLPFGRLARAAFAPDWGLIRRLLVLGAPLGGGLVLKFGALSVFTTWLAGVGVDAAATFGVLVNLAGLLFIGVVGFGQAGAVRIAQAQAAGDRVGLRRTVTACNLLVLSTYATLGVALFGIRDPVLAVYVGDPSALALSPWTWALFLSLVLCDAMQAGRGAQLVGLADTIVPFFGMIGAYALVSAVVVGLADLLAPVDAALASLCIGYLSLAVFFRYRLQTGATRVSIQPAPTPKPSGG